MTTLLLPAPPPAALPALRIARPTAQSLLDAFLEGRKPTTLRAYRLALEGFASFAGLPSANEAVAWFVSLDQGYANAVALQYRNSMTGASPSTVNVRLAALRSVVQLGRRLGVVPWTLEVKGPKAQTFKDTAGPGRDAYKAMLAAIEGDSPKAKRDRAIMKLLHDVALRRREVVGLDVEHLEGSRLWILGKGRDEREAVTVPPGALSAVRDWLAARGEAPGPLFCALDQRHPMGSQRLSGAGVWRIVSALGRAAGVKTWPHAMRHLSISTSVERGCNINDVRKFARHASILTTQRYIDNHDDAAGRVAALVGADD